MGMDYISNNALEGAIAAAVSSVVLPYNLLHLPLPNPQQLVRPCAL